ncbi:hypothetical protein [Paenibacillus cineris]|uniref:hypothetical protein n=1 Tax=Paenibacillus cineris TaxID=237530 RepID=UPI001B05E5E7|nr:hypothetical protein [Paenibacillus cineris]GIO63595.1 hypothetical protein J43TS9_51690 [Paenibacillus cineris]
MIEELHIAAQYGQRIIVRLKDGEKVTGKALLTTFPDRVKVQTIDETVWIPHQDIEHVERLVKYH